MNCDELKELISAYTDDELPPAQRDFIAEHLSRCADCQAVFTDYKKTGDQMSALRVTQLSPDITAAVMTRIKINKILRKPRKWLRPTLAAMPIVMVLITVSSLYLAGFFISPESIIAKAYAATDKVQSWRVGYTSYLQYSTTGNAVEVGSSTLQYAGQNLIQTNSSSGFEFILINDTLYLNDSSNPQFQELELAKKILQGYSFYTPGSDRTSITLDSMVDIKQLPDENVDGVQCLHYQANTDIEKLMADQKAYFGSNPIFTKEFRERVINSMRLRKVSIELWIGKDDHFIYRRRTIDQPADIGLVSYSNPVTIGDYKYYDFNKPLTITAPLDSNGNLLGSWQIYGGN